MKHTYFPVRLWFAAGLLLSFLAFLVIWWGLAGRVFITDSEGLQDAANSVMNSIHTGDWATLTQLVAGNTALSPETGGEGSSEKLIWDSYCSSLQWTCADALTVHGPYVSLKVTVACLDIPGITESMAERMKSTPATVSETQTQILKNAAEQILNTDAPRKEQEITLTFFREQKQWKLVPDRGLQALLSGFTAS